MAVDGFLDPIGGGGGLDMVEGTGGARGGLPSDRGVRKGISELDLAAGLGGGLRRFATKGLMV